MSDPVDATTTSAWTRLEELRQAYEPDLRSAFAQDPDRAARFTRTAADLYVDLSKNLVDDDILAALVDLADQVG
ncbi:MAG: glucose-6-phosphate isomerase, partial [Janthinobacterium lividum]